MRVSAISRDGFFSLLALDQITTLSERSGLSFRNRHEAAELEKLVLGLTQEYSGAFSGVVLSPEFGYAALEEKAEQTGVLFPLERRLLDSDPLSLPILLPGWGVEAVRGNYGVAKLELCYNPGEKEAAAKRQFVAEIYDYCQHEGIDLVLELLLYIESTPSQYSQLFPELQLQAVQDFRRSCSVMALEYPFTALSAVTVTAQLDIPWILTARDTPYDVFKEQLRTVLESGGKGFMGIEQFLGEGKELMTPTGRDRVLELTRIVAEARG